MSKEKQIEEMARIIDDNHGFIVSSVETAEKLYNAGYRKQRVGEWLVKWRSTFPQYEPSEYQCSICGYVRTVKHKFCPNCGAKMKGGE